MAKLGKDETVQLDTLLKICEVLECDIEEIVEFKNGGEIIMANNHEREELHKAIWSIADDLRGSVDGWDFKQYILGIMFYRYISENITNYINEGERKAGDTTFDYTKLADADAEYERENLVKEKGFFIRPSELFCNVIKAAKSDTATFTDVEGKTKSVKDNLNEYLEMIFNNIENPL
jgi:type I restriction enzyme M protein